MLKPLVNQIIMFLSLCNDELSILGLVGVEQWPFPYICQTLFFYVCFFRGILIDGNVKIIYRYDGLM